MSKKLLFVLAIVGVLSFSSMASAEWKHGIGPSATIFTVDGEVGFPSSYGVTNLKVKSSIKDINDRMFGLVGYSTNDEWLIRYKVFSVSIESYEQGTRPAAAASTALATISGKAELDIVNAEITAGYCFFDDYGFKSRFYFGARYVNHNGDFFIDGWDETAQAVTRTNSSMGGNWVTGVFGLSAEVPIIDNLKMTADADISTFGAKLGYGAGVNLEYCFLENKSVNLFMRYTSVDNDLGIKGGNNYYNYDVDEMSVGASFVFNF